MASATINYNQVLHEALEEYEKWKRSIPYLPPKDRRLIRQLEVDLQYLAEVVYGPY